jgi:hypothetical protein
MSVRARWDGRLGFVVRFVELDLKSLSTDGWRQLRTEALHFLKGDETSIHEFNSVGAPFYPNPGIDDVSNEAFEALQAKLRSMLQRVLAQRDEPARGSVFEGVELPTLKLGLTFPTGGGSRDRSSLLVTSDLTHPPWDIAQQREEDSKGLPRAIAERNAQRALQDRGFQDAFVLTLLLELAHVSSSKIRRCPARAPWAGGKSGSCGRLFVPTRHQKFCSLRCADRERVALFRSREHGRRRHRTRKRARSRARRARRPGQRA